MGFLDRIGRKNRIGRFEEGHHLSKDDRDKINAEVKKVYHNITQGYMTRAQGKEHILKYITLLLKTKYPGIDFEKTGLAGKINRYASMRIRKFDEGDIGLGQAKREGESNKIRNDLRNEANKFIKYRAKYKTLDKPNEDELRLFLYNYARSKGYSARGFIEEVVAEYSASGNVATIDESKLGGKEFEKYKYDEKRYRSNVNIDKFMNKPRRDAREDKMRTDMAGTIAAAAMAHPEWATADKKMKKEIVRGIVEQMQIIWDEVNS